MKKFFFLIMVLSVEALAQRKFDLGTQSQVKWKGSMVVGGSHEGTLIPTAGSLIISADGKPTHGDLTVDMNTIRTIDVKPAKSARELEDHLKSDDFFAVGKFPKAFFSILKVTPSTTYPNTNAYTITGVLMIRGISNQVVFPASVAITGGTARVNAEMHVDRTKWDIIYHSANFFGTAKNELISDQIKISIDLTFIEKR